jgi:hypothetical protein
MNQLIDLKTKTLPLLTALALGIGKKGVQTKTVIAGLPVVRLMLALSIGLILSSR